jgi:hypothetical protein
MSLINKISKFFNSKSPETENKIMVPDYKQPEVSIRDEYGRV